MIISDFIRADYTRMTPEGDFYYRSEEEFGNELFKRSGERNRERDYEAYIDELDRLHNKLSENLEKLRKADPKRMYGKNNKLLKEPTRQLMGGLMTDNEFKWYSDMLKLVPHEKPPQREPVKKESWDENLLRTYLEQDTQYILTEELPELKSVEEIGDYFTNLGAIGGISYVRPPVTTNLDGKTYRQHLWTVYQRKLKPEKVKRPVKRQLDYPFRSKYGFFRDQQTLSVIPDMKPKNYAKKLKKPVFSATPGGYQLDLLSLGRDAEGKIKGYILFMINMNSKFLFTRDLIGKSADALLMELVKVINKIKAQNLPIHTIKSDAEAGLRAIFSNERFQRQVPDVTLIWSSSPYTNHVRVVDRVMKTFRDALGVDVLNDIFDDYGLVKQIRDYYNKTPHKSLTINDHMFTPSDVQRDVDLEWMFIRENLHKLNQVNNNLRAKGLLDMKPGMILMCSLSHGKSGEGFAKRRRSYDKLCMFLGYFHGNAVVRQLHPLKNIADTVPLYSCVVIASDISRLDETQMRNTFNVNLQPLIDAVNRTKVSFPEFMS